MQRTFSTKALIIAAITGAIVALTVILNLSKNTPNTAHKTLALPMQTVKNTAPTAKLLVEKTVSIKSGDSCSSILHKLKIPFTTQQRLLANTDMSALCKRLPLGKSLTFAFNPAHALQTVEFDKNAVTQLALKMHNNRFISHASKRRIEKQHQYVQLSLRSNLAASAKAAHLPIAYIYQLEHIFHWQVNFRRDLHPGDVFNVVYETDWIDNQKLKNGPIVAAEYIHKKKHITAIRFEDKHGNTHYYTPQGKSLNKAIVRAPLHYRRISSTFSLNRYHPVLHIWRPHYGVDYAAPAGTAIHAAGDGIVFFAGRSRGYGNMIRIRHDRKYSTVYGHMRRFAKHIHRGMHVLQGQVIGYVGQTGLATGPHLHFEVRVFNHPKNPRTVALPNRRPIPKRQLALFKAKLPLALKELHTATA